MKINVAPLITDTQIQSNPTTQLPTGFSGDVATNYTQIKNYILNQIGFAPLFDSNTKGQAIDLNAVDLNAIESATPAYNTSGLYSPRANCTNGPIALDGVMIWLRSNINEQLQIFNSTAAILYYRRKTGGTWGSWKTVTGITNTAATNELMKSDGTNAVPSTIFATSDGRLYGTSLHNNAGSVTGTTNQYIASGTYTPTLFNTTNVSSSTAFSCQWIRVGNVVTVSGLVTITATAATNTVLRMSLPITSSFGNISNCCGTHNQSSATENAGVIYANSGGAQAEFQYVAVSLSGLTRAFTFTYVIL